MHRSLKECPSLVLLEGLDSIAVRTSVKRAGSRRDPLVGRIEINDFTVDRASTVGKALTDLASHDRIAVAGGIGLVAVRPPVSELLGNSLEDFLSRRVDVQFQFDLHVTILC